MSDLGLNSEQLANAQAIISEGKARKMSQKDITTAIMVAYTESSLQNYANSTVPESLALPHDNVGHDTDSVGLFQQRSEYWGNVTDLMDPKTAAGKFYDALTKIPSRDTADPATVAQEVQDSKFGDGSNYRANIGKAQEIVAALYGNSSATTVSDVTNAPLDAFQKVAGWITNPKDWQRIGLFLMGAIILFIMLTKLMADTGVIAKATKVVKRGAEIAAL